MLLILNNISSFCLVVVFYLLIRQNAWIKEPYGRAISIGYTICLLLVAYTALIRNGFSEFAQTEQVIIGSKFAIAGTLFLVVLRLDRMHNKK